MSWPDLVTGLFELVAGAMLGLNVLATYRAKGTVGLSLTSVGFFVAWDVWFLYFYATLGQWASFVGGVWVVAVYLAWVGQILYYRRKKRRDLEVLKDAAIRLNDALNAKYSAPCPCYPNGNPGNCPAPGCK